MQHTKYNAFGYILSKIEVDKDEILTDEDNEHTGNTILISRPYNPDFKKQNYVPKTANHIWLLTEGHINYVNLYTGVSVDWEEGYCSLDTPMPIGFWASTHAEDSVVFCFSPMLNLDNLPVMPDVSSFKLNIGESVTTSESTRIFLCDGEMSVNGTAVVGPKQVVISTGKTITATTKVYGFKFN